MYMILMGCSHVKEVAKYTNVPLGTDKNVLFMEVSSQLVHKLVP